MVIEVAKPQDLSDVQTLLARHQLPLDGLDQHVQTLLVARDDGHVVGSAALELYAEGALLRSVAVNPTVQGRGVGRRLTEAALQMARRHGAKTVFLLTTTAERFFPRFGFESVTRADVPVSVQESIEFRSACPESAAVMRKRF
jgi:amino-acid N-acetyltransferase